MKRLTKISQIALIIFFCVCNSGCSSKIETITAFKCDIPQKLLIAPKIEKRAVNSQTETAILLLDTFEAYEKCKLNLNSIKAIINENEKQYQK